MFRGEDKAPYMMSDLNIGFEVITQSETDEGLDENDITNAFERRYRSMKERLIHSKIC